MSTRRKEKQTAGTTLYNPNLMPHPLNHHQPPSSPTYTHQISPSLISFPHHRIPHIIIILTASSSSSSSPFIISLPYPQPHQQRHHPLSRSHLHHHPPMIITII